MRTKELAMVDAHFQAIYCHLLMGGWQLVLEENIGQTEKCWLSLSTMPNKPL
jgi:hypothetical protein